MQTNGCSAQFKTQTNKGTDEGDEEATATATATAISTLVNGITMKHPTDVTAFTPELFGFIFVCGRVLPGLSLNWSSRPMIDFGFFCAFVHRLRQCHELTQQPFLPVWAIAAAILSWSFQSYHRCQRGVVSRTTLQIRHRYMDVRVDGGTGVGIDHLGQLLETFRTRDGLAEILHLSDWNDSHFDSAHHYGVGTAL